MKTVQKAALVATSFLAIALLAACPAESSASGGSGSVIEESSTPASKTNVFESYSGTLGTNATDSEIPTFATHIYLNLTNQTYSTDGSAYSAIPTEEATITDSITMVNTSGKIDINQENAAGTVQYTVTGTLNGELDITTAKKAKVGLVLSGVDITSGNYPAINIGKKNTVVYVTLSGTNYLTDGRVYGTGYSKEDGVGYTTDSSKVSTGNADEDDDVYLTQKWALGSDANGTLNTKGSFRFSGDGTLAVSTAYKHGIYAKNRIYVFGGNLGVYNTGRNGIQSKNGFDMAGGTVYIKGEGTHTNKQSRGIIVAGDVEDGIGLGGMTITGGAITINTVGKAISAKWDIDDEEDNPNGLTYTASGDATTPLPVIIISGGTFDITTTGSVIDSERSSNVTYYDADGISVTETQKCSPEGIEGKLGIAISGGTFTINTTDDALNASWDKDGYISISGGELYLVASSADAIDSNGDITISGGTIVAVATMGSEDGFDCDGALTFTGGLAVGISGSSHYYASTSNTKNTQNTFVIGKNYTGSAGSTMVIKDDDTTVFAFTIPSAASSYSLITLSSPNLVAGKTYTIYSGASVSGGTSFKGLYTELPTVSGGTSNGTITTTSGTTVYTLGVSSSSGGPGGPGGTPPTH